MASVKRMDTAFDTVMATMWTFKAMVDSQPEAACGDERVEEALNVLMKAVSEMNDTIQSVLRGC